MNNQHFSQDDFKKLGTPIQKLMHLNLNTLKSFSDFNAEDFFNTKQPDRLWKKNLEVFLKNSQRGLIYLQGIFSLMEEHLSALGADAAKKVEAVTVKKSVKKPVKKSAASPVKKASVQAKKAVSSIKKASPKKKAASAVKATVKSAALVKKATAKISVANKTTKSAPKTLQMQASAKKPETKNGASLHNPSHFKPATHQGIKPNF